MISFDPVILVWWITLLAALMLTIPILLVILRVVFFLREIDRLAREAAQSSAGIADNTATVAALDAVLAQTVRLLGGVQAIGGVAISIRGHVATVGAALAPLRRA
jgi:hypothetical protein